eukprot:scaffold74366_cov67-Phaeocystis_antarctica.AAC.4
MTLAQPTGVSCGAAMRVVLTVERGRAVATWLTGTTTPSNSFTVGECDHCPKLNFVGACTGWFKNGTRSAEVSVSRRNTDVCSSIGGVSERTIRSGNASGRGVPVLPRSDASETFANYEVAGGTTGGRAAGRVLRAPPRTEVRFTQSVLAKLERPEPAQERHEARVLDVAGAQVAVDGDVGEAGIYLRQTSRKRARAA